MTLEKVIMSKQLIENELNFRVHNACEASIVL